MIIPTRDGVGILNGTTNQSGNFTMGLVDVRDVADIHIKAMESENAAGKRFLANSDGVISFYDVAELIKKERPSLAGNIAEMQPTPSEFYKEMSNEKAKSIFKLESQKQGRSHFIKC